MAPALRLRSDRNESLSDANLKSALSKSKSSRNDEPRGDCAPLIVKLLRLLLEPFAFASAEFSERIENRWNE
jgi:hypothetical protein